MMRAIMPAPATLVMSMATTLSVFVVVMISVAVCVTVSARILRIQGCYLFNNLVILCHGRVVEDRPKTAVVEDLLHPYTQLLMSAVPIPDPKRRWEDSVDLTSLESFEKLRAEKGCVFSMRCPHVMDECKQRVPELVEVEPGRKVACFLCSKK